MPYHDCSSPNRLLADPRSERAACGTGFIADLSGRATHSLLRNALTTLNRLAHRGAMAADARTGDGAGVLTQIPHRLFERELSRAGLAAPARSDLSVGVCFLPRDDATHALAKQIIGDAIAARGLDLLMWRDVPIDLDALGEHARRTRPHICQVLVARTQSVGAGDDYERALYLARKEVERRAREEHIQPLYLPSFSARTIVYKGLFVSPQLAPFYSDLRDPLYETALALFHQRYSTNTFPTWERAQPFRLLCHNGEINTLQGNIAWMRAREPHLASPLFGDAVKSLLPILDTEGSDSAMLDNALEMLTLSGRDAAHSLMMLVPEAWENVTDLPPALRAFYHYHSMLMEPWDGPAALAFSDGRVAGMALDRNGLRPARYLATDDGLVVAASEIGAYEADPARVIEKGKLGPGQMVIADLASGKLWHNGDIKMHYASYKPYEKWLEKSVHPLGMNDPVYSRENSHLFPLLKLQAAFGYTEEELSVIVRHMAEDGVEPIASMGDDTPHAVLSEFERPLYHFFKQHFAEVTNPPIDPLREQLVMSSRVLLGARNNILGELAAPLRLLELASPFVTNEQLAQIRMLEAKFPHAVLDATFPVLLPERKVLQPKGALLENALDDLCLQAEQAVDDGKVILILSDREISATRAPIPMLLATSAVHQHLLRVGKRWKTSLVAQVGDAREVHQFACLLGFGANAVNPYLALASAQAMVLEGHSRQAGLTPKRAEENFVHAAEKGVLKIMSKMGIATMDAYQGAQIFECLGLAQAVIDKYFTGTPSPIGGVNLDNIAEAALEHHAHAFGRDANQLKSHGLFKYRRSGEHHAYNPEVVRMLNSAVRTPGALNGNYSEAYANYLAFTEHVHARPATDIADQLEIQYGDCIPIDRVEPVSEIVKRFSSAAMSHGALSLEAHEAVAIALSRIGALSNSGEGGEHPSRYGTESNSPIKQVASARFGVTPAYLMSADELQIKMAQGSKPGEGGQLPAHKVSAEIAAIRHAQPGISLISPPPHHDIYSIEDLAQLIYDLKRVNPRAKVSVKLVAQAGVGTIAAGVAKAHADIVHISGHSGGTGASPLSSIKNAGSAWELGLAETQQILLASDLRARVRVRVDGGLMTARHVIIAALLGADEFSFGTAPLIAAGCMMARACHLNTCPTGIATQDPKLRSKFPNRPEWIMAYFLFLADETRHHLAAMGCTSLDSIIGRVDRLRHSPAHSRTAPLPVTISMPIPERIAD